ncbi:MAG: pyridoxal kinase [Pseudomonadota bacterium]
MSLPAASQASPADTALACAGPVLAVQSFVAAGRVGHRAGSFALERLGREVVQIPTTLLSGHAATPGVAGQKLPAAEIDALLGGVAKAGVLPKLSAVLTGYLGSAETVGVVARMLTAPRDPSVGQGSPDSAGRLAPGIPVLCDPVLGDEGPGLYLPAEVGEAYRTQLLPHVAIATPNAFELGWLTGSRPQSVRDAVLTARTLGPPRVFVTSLVEGLAEGQIGILAVTPNSAHLAATPRFEADPKGAGDLCAALLLDAVLRGAAPGDAAASVAGRLHAVIDASLRAGHRDGLDLIGAQALLDPAAAVEGSAVSLASLEF